MQMVAVVAELMSFLLVEWKLGCWISGHGFTDAGDISFKWSVLGKCL